MSDGAAMTKDTICSPGDTYYVFHGTSRSRDPRDHEYPASGTARTTMVGHGATQSAAYDDARRHEAERGTKGHDFSGIGHVSGPHKQ